MRYQHIAAVLLILTVSTPSLAMDESFKQQPPGNVITNIWNGAASRVRGALNFRKGTSEAPQPDPKLFTGSPIGQSPIRPENVIDTLSSKTFNDPSGSLPSGINKGMRKTGYSLDCGAEGYKIRGNLAAAWQLISAIRSKEVLILEQQKDDTEEIQVVADFDTEINQLEGIIRVMKKDLITYWVVDPRRPIYAAKIFLVERQWREIKSKYQLQSSNLLGENSKGIARGNSIIRNQWRRFRTFAGTQIERFQSTKLKEIIEELKRKANVAKEYVMEMTNEWRNKAQECMRFRGFTGNGLFTQ